MVNTLSHRLRCLRPEISLRLEKIIHFQYTPVSRKLLGQVSLSIVFITPPHCFLPHFRFRNVTMSRCESNNLNFVSSFHRL